MYIASGDYGAIKFEGAADAGSRYLSLDTQASVQFFKRIAVMKTNIIMNSLGLYSFAPLDRRGNARFASLSVPSFLLKPRELGCAWDPVRGINIESGEFPSEAYEFQGEQCPDVLYDTCFKAIFGGGNEGRDMLATPEGKALFGEMMELLYLGLGNSFYEVVTFANHPLIDEVDTNQWYHIAGVDDATWKKAYKMLKAKKIAGHIAMIDMLKNQGVDQYNVLLEDYISADGLTFTGNITDAFDAVLAAQPTPMKRAGSSTRGIVGKSVLLVHPIEYRAYKKYIQDNYTTIPETLKYFITNDFAASMGLSSGYAVDVNDVMMYDGHPVVCMHDWEDFDALTSTITHRILAVTPGNFGVGHDVPGLKQFEGLAGLRMVQKLDAPDNGKIYMDTLFEVAPGLANEKFCVNASLTFRPATDAVE